jgi:hypothetical protein
MAGLDRDDGRPTFTRFLEREINGLSPERRLAARKTRRWITCDAVELGGADQGVNRRGWLAAPIGTGEQSGLAAERGAAERSLGGVITEADAAVLDPQAWLADVLRRIAPTTQPDVVLGAYKMVLEIGVPDVVEPSWAISLPASAAL